MTIDWSKQHCGIIRATFCRALCEMPDLEPILRSFPEDGREFTWDIKVHMLMPGQYPCIPNWHYDNIPQDADGNKRPERIKEFWPMYMWVSGHPLPEFYFGGEIPSETWVRFTQQDLHRGKPAECHTWRGFIRATSRNIMEPIVCTTRRHSQVYLDAKNFTW